MRKQIGLFVFALAALLCCGAQAARAQGVARGNEPTVVRDPEAERESMHDLEVARHYFKLKKAYKAALARCEEIIAGNPEFSRADEALYLAGMSSLRLAESRGKQRSDIPADKLRDDARQYLSRVVADFPDSEFRKPAQEQLRALGGVAAATPGAGAKP